MLHFNEYEKRNLKLLFQQILREQIMEIYYFC